jgi:geranylgeranyl diphosphate synthase type II
VDQKVVDYIHSRKTAALITASVQVGARLAGAGDDAFRALSAYGERVGLAFQIVDDILDEEGTTEQLGKDAGSDRQRGKATYPRVHGLEESRTRAVELIDGACEDVATLGERAELLRGLAQYIRTRLR